MKKWVVPILSVLLVLVLVYLSGPSPYSKTTTSYEARVESKNARMLLTQGSEKEEKREETDPYWLQLLVQIQVELDAWLKSLNERIESKEVSRIEVRFLEVLRNILEWVKEKVDAKIEASKGKGAPKKGGVFRETRNRRFNITMG